jgi:hypothetical protein
MIPLSYRLLALAGRRLVCKVREHDFQSLGEHGARRLTIRCTRCGETRVLGWARHQGQRERVRRMNQILKGQIEPAPGERAKLLVAVRAAQRKARRDDEVSITYED